MQRQRSMLDRASRLSRKHPMLTWESIAALQSQGTTEWEFDAALLASELGLDLESEHQDPPSSETK